MADFDAQRRGKGAALLRLPLHRWVGKRKDDMKPITVWERWYNKPAPGRYEHNHIEGGHSDRDVPRAIIQEQHNSWINADGWKATFCYLDADNKVVPNVQIEARRAVAPSLSNAGLWVNTTE